MPNESTGDAGGHSQPLAVSKLPAGDLPALVVRLREISEAAYGDMEGANLEDFQISERLYVSFAEAATALECALAGEPAGCAASEHLRVVTARPPETKLERADLALTDEAEAVSGEGSSFGRMIYRLLFARSEGGHNAAMSHTGPENPTNKP